MSKSKRLKEQKEQESEHVDHAGDAQYGFVVLKRNDGTITVQPLKEEQGVKKPPTIDDIYSAATIVLRNIDTQRTAAAIQSAVLQAAQEAGYDSERTESGLVVPK